MWMWSASYLVVVIAVLTVSITIDDDEGVRLMHILVAAFGWPLFAPVMLWKAWVSR